MATFNGQDYLREQLASIAEQSVLPDELVISDDGSTDGTLDTVRRFAASSPFPVQIHRNIDRLGYSRNFERAIAQCKGDVIFLADQDDVWFPNKLEIVGAEFQSEAVMAVLHNQLITNAELKHRSITMLDNVRRLRKTSDSLIEGCCTAFRRQWGELLLPMPTEGQTFIESGDLSHDQWINQLSILLGARVFIERPLQYFRRHQRNVTRWVGNDPNGARVTDLVVGRVNHAPVEAWLRRAQVLDLYEGWLRANRGQLERMGVHSVERALEELTAERRGYIGRAAIAQLPFRRRISTTWQMWRSGGYRYFHGFTSALRDLGRRA